MGFLNPLFLAAAVAVAVPLLLHLFHRQELRRLAFPALRYLQRTEREHAARIRLRQLLLLMLRIGAVLLAVAAGARPFLRGAGSAHPPTAVAIVLDNSLSSGLLQGDRRVLDGLKELAEATIDRAGDRDRFWIVRAGEPWDVAPPQSAEDARARIRRTEVSAARGDLDEALERAASLVASSELTIREVHLLSDLQRSAFPADNPRPADDLLLVAYAPDEAATGNRSIDGVVVGGGLPPIQGQRTQLSARVTGDSTAADSVSVRLIVDDQIRGASVVPPNTEVLFPLEIATTGPITGYVEVDPDDLNADDRRFFAFEVRPPPPVRVMGPVGPFLREALQVLNESRRLELTDRGPATVVTGGAEGFRTDDAVRVVIPPTDPLLLPGLNRRLAEARVPWRYVEAETDGELGVAASALPYALEEIAVSRHYTLEPTQGGDRAGTVFATLTSGTPWIVSVETGTGRHLLLGSPVDPGWSTLPVSSLLVPMLEWALGRWAADAEMDPEITAGEVLTLPAETSGLGDPDGELIPLGGASPRPVKTGVYTAVGPDGPLARWVVNPAPEESDLNALHPDELRLRAERLKLATDAGSWTRAIFDRRQGPELWRYLLAALLLVLVVESVVASSGRREQGAGPVEVSPT